MKILRLKLENWRGVGLCEVVFRNNVTLIEGPNEAGKSSIVEAIQVLFTVMDSSGKTDIRAIQPVGKDVGSSVEVEIQTGDYHFVYSKTYNKNKQTELRVLAPQPQQLTGREAHERAEQILKESVDMDLWNALLVEQGSGIVGVTLSKSNGLARALDEAAGGNSPEDDDSDLFGRVEAEYGQYYTLIAGKSRFALLESELNDKRVGVERAEAALGEVETDRDDYELCLAETRRHEKELPRMQEEEETYSVKWQGISEGKEKVEAKNLERETARQLLDAVNDDLGRRKILVESAEEKAQELEADRAQLAIEAQQVSELKTSADEASENLIEATTKKRQLRIDADLARADEIHLANVKELDSISRKLGQIRNFNEQRATALQALQGVTINPDGLELLRKAEQEFQVALGRLDTATSSIEITAESSLKLSLNDEEIELSDGDIERRDIAAELGIAIPGVVRIQVVPSQSANELEADKEECRESLERLLKQYSVDDLADAVAVESKRSEDKQVAESWREKIEELLVGATEADLQTRVDDLNVLIENYIGQRPAEPSMPASVAAAQEVLAEAGVRLDDCERTLEEREAARGESRDHYNEANVNLRMAETEVTGKERIRNQLQQELENARAAEADEEVEERAEGKQTIVDVLYEELTTLKNELESFSPETVEALYSNAKAACNRATDELAKQQMKLAILKDRLTQAQADGRYERLEDLKHKLATLESRYNAKVARAEAAKRLWEVLNTYRDAARKVYVRPLKEGIEQLGKIVFGSDFAIELGEDWEMVSRTLDSKTIPFDDLSVGAREQLGILMRLTAARIVSSQGGVPLIIDDAMGFADPTRLRTMGAAIATAGNDCQIILLSCTPGRFTYVGSADVVKI